MWTLKRRLEGDWLGVVSCRHPYNYLAGVFKQKLDERRRRTLQVNSLGAENKRMTGYS